MKNIVAELYNLACLKEWVPSRFEPNVYVPGEKKDLPKTKAGLLFRTTFRDLCAAELLGKEVKTNP